MSNGYGYRKKTSIITIISTIVLVVLLCLAAFLAVDRLGIKIIDNDVKLTYVITVTDVPESVAEQLFMGQVVYDRGTNRELGTVSILSKEPAVLVGIDQATGEQVKNELDGMVDLKITVNAMAKRGKNGYSVGGCDIVCGMEYALRTYDVSFDGVCTSLSEQ